MSKNKKTKYATLSLPDGKKYKLPILSGTIGPDVIEIKNLYNDTDKFTYDPGYTSTGSCKSKITYIDGEKGILLHFYKIDIERDIHIGVFYPLNIPYLEKNIKEWKTKMIKKYMNEDCQEVFEREAGNPHPWICLAARTHLSRTV